MWRIHFASYLYLLSSLPSAYAAGQAAFPCQLCDGQAELLKCHHCPRSPHSLQAFAAAEAAYSRAMSAVAKLSLSSEADGPSLRATMARASDLPDMMGLAHSSVSGAKHLKVG